MKMRKMLIVLLLLLNIISVNSQVRQYIRISDNWRFYKGLIESNTPEDSTWEQIAIPHTWNKEDGTGDADRKYYRGYGTYSHKLHIPKKLKNKRLFLRFEAVSTVADVYLNGEYLGKHDNGFNAFCFEITDIAKAGDNQLVVKATNEWNENIAPLAGDFTVFGGIYRPVWLVALDKICISPLDHASSGIYVTQSKVTDNQATIDIKAKINNGSDKRKELNILFQLFDNTNKLITSDIQKVTVDKGETNDVHSQMIVNHPILWNAKNNPHLYSLSTRIMEGKKLKDSLTQRIGLRYFEIHPQKGFILNGKPYNIRGVNRHQDRQGMGWAISNKEHKEDMELIKEIGANGIRLAHYPHSNYFYDLCDENGLLVWAEIPFIERATQSTEFINNIKTQLTELIRQNYNHPSIFCWGLFNELTKGEPQNIVKELNDLAHREDPTRITVAAPNHQNRAENKISDHLAHNTYPGWYWAGPEGMGGSLDNWNGSMGNKGIAVSEYGAGASIHHHEQGMKNTAKTDGSWHPEEWQAIVHEKNYKEIKKRDFVWGSFVWNMFDFAVASRNEGDTPGMNDKGLVTYDRKTKKDAFFFYKANWSDEPVVYITSRRHITRKDPVCEVKVYSNTAGLKLFVNGEDKGSAISENCVYIWKDITLKQGENKISVTGNFDNKIISDECIWFLE
ncbi:glycoside hydrolase family 2 protein [Prevotella sp. 10(H)]|uniref:glycoside hydrolase family 2 protein n=1 Tax=Prevotella sp. 10(H) TaxID=1158294 RepID=UPI0005629A82|nr:glycoside hydrolase family 2 [Prevotella sp. 10(H)]